MPRFRTLSVALLGAALFLVPAPARTEDDAVKLLETFNEEFVPITPGRGRFPKSFTMGRDGGPAEERPAQDVTFDYDFAIAKYEVPQNLYEAVMGENPSRWKGPRNSVEMMTWAEANTFCERVTQKLRAAKLIADDEVIRLPTEAEWEYTCRAGTKTQYSFGDEATKPGDAGKKASLLDKYAWHTGNAAGNDPPVGALAPNPWGLYDVHGYLWEFVADEWSKDHTNAPRNGSAAASSAEKKSYVVRGGSWKDRYERLTSSSRQKVAATTKDDAIGFRCVKVRRRPKPTLDKE